MSPTFKERLARGEARCGLWSAVDSPTVAEILAYAGADWLLLDMEHSAADVPSILRQLQAARGASTPLIVRAPNDQSVTLKRLLDIGAETLLVPFVNDAEQATRVVRATRYPPDGSRGVAGSNRAALYGRDRSNLHDANQRVCTLVQVETALAVENAQQIAEVSGVDGIFVGPADLAADLGHIGDTEHPDVRRAIARVLETVSRVGKPVGTFASSPSAARERLAEGFAFVAVITDVRLLVQGAQRALEEARGSATAVTGSPLVI